MTMTPKQALPELDFQASLQSQLKKSLEHSVGDAFMQKSKTKAWDHFLSHGLPSRKTEQYQYIRLHNLFAQTYTVAPASQISKEQIAPFVIPECSDACIVFVNGHLQSHLSSLTGIPKQVVLLPFSEATKSYGAFLNNHWSKALKDEKDSFATLNAALHLNGAFLYIPPKVVVESPIQILYLTDSTNLQIAPQRVASHPRMQIFAGTRSQSSFVTTQAYLSPSGCLLNQSTDIAIEEDATVQYTQIACNASANMWVFDALRATLKRNGKLTTTCVTDGAATSRHDYRIGLTGENGEVTLNGLWTLSDNRESHVNILVEHQAPHCRSMQRFKGVLNDSSRSSFEGKILVQQAAQKTEAFQLNNNLLLSDSAQANSKPNLEIYADDVKASHGATVGQLDQEQLFYMKTRGFSHAAAQRMLVHSYCKEIIDCIPIFSLQQDLNKQLFQQAS